MNQRKRRLRNVMPSEHQVYQPVEDLSQHPEPQEISFRNLNHMLTSVI